MDLVGEWIEAAKEEISLEEMDSRVEKLSLLWKKCEEAKAAKKVVDDDYDQYERETLELLQKAGKTKYQVDGIGTIYQINRFITRTPKSSEQKKLFFNWIRDTKGPEALMGLLSVNSQTLNAFVNQEYETTPGVTIPGLEAPTSQLSLGFKSERNK